MLIAVLVYTVVSTVRNCPSVSLVLTLSLQGAQGMLHQYIKVLWLD